jgi:flagellar assembly protein FliH
MGLIKSSVAPSKLQAFTMKDVEAHAALLVARAKAKADQILAEATAAGERLKAEAQKLGAAEGRTAGYAQGLEEGRKAGHAEAIKKATPQLDQLIAGLQGSAEKLEISRKKLETETVLDVIDLSVAIARKVTRRLGEVDPEVVKANVAEALRMAVGASAVKVAVHPSLVAILEAESVPLRRAFPRLERFEIIADPALAPGGCRLVTGSGAVDADLERQLDRVVADLVPTPASLAGRSSLAGQNTPATPNVPPATPNVPPAVPPPPGGPK